LDSAWEIVFALAGGSVTAGSVTAGSVTAGSAVAGWTRRAVLAAAAGLPLLAVSGCRGVGALATPPRPAPDVAVLRSAIAAEEVMIARYDAVMTASAGLAARLRPLRAEHRLHLAQLRSRLIVPPDGAAAAAPSGSASPAGKPPAGPGSGPAAAISYLQAAEHAAATTLLRQLAAVSPSLAQLMASVAASEATHVAALAAAGGAGGAGHA
jgi:hypothetical protein